MALKKPSDLFGNKTDDNNTLVIESDSSFHEELIKVESLSEQVIQLQQELSQKVIKNDLESLVLSQINTMQENFEYLQNDFKKSNKKDIVEFKERVSELSEIVGNLVENELPKYKKQITNNEIRIGEKFDVLKEKVEENILNIKEDVDTKVNSIAEVIDTNLEYFNNQLQETSTEVKKTTDTYNKLSKIVESKVSKENEKLEEYSQVIQSLHEAFIELENSLQEESSNSQRIVEKQIESYKNEITSEQLLSEKKLETYKNKLEISVDNRLENYQKELKDVKADVVINEQHIKNVDEYLKEHHQELVELKEEVFSEIGQIPVGDLQENLNRLEKKIDFIKETYSKIEPEVIVKEVIREGLLNEPPNTKNSDPLTPLDQKFVTLNQLQEHYRLFINRIQQQLSTIGGGGETRLEFLDDVDRDSIKQDGYILQYNSSVGKFIGTSYVPGGGGGNGNYADVAGISTYATIAGISTYSTSSGIATYASTAGIATYASTAGIATYATSSGIATYASTAGIATYASTAGVSTNVIGGIASVISLNVSGVSTISVNSSDSALTINQTGSGNALIVEDSANPDATPFVVTNTGDVGIGTTNPTSKLTIDGTVSATAFVGDGSGLTNIPGGSGTIGIATAGGTVGTGVTLLDFRGAGISTVTVSSGIGTINITGGSGSSTPDISPVMMGMIF